MSRLLPPRPNLDHLKKEAKSLLKNHSSGDTAVCQMLRHLHRFSDATDEDILASDVSLTDVQYALAMDYGFLSWEALRNTVLNTENDQKNVAALVSRVLTDAIRTGASDLHFEPFENAYRLRMRVDGILRETEEINFELGAKIAARFKDMSRMDLSERRLPQKGSLTFRVSNAKTINFRVAALPVLFGEKISLRVADSAVAKVEMDQLGYEPDQLERVLDALHKPRGLVLVTGPTGSGKTVSLYTALTRISRPEVSISTVEDPVEILLEGINQCPVNPAIGLDYENALKAIMSHDPDIVMAAELPDLATANAAFKAAQTGHLVLSSVNTNSAPETLTFLRNLGISSYNLANSINLIIAQRLARRLCKHCRVLLDMPKDALIEEGFSEKDMASVLHIYKPGGCQECEKGYKGRVGIFEVVEITSEIARVIMSGGSALQIAEVCQQEGFPNLYQSGLKKVMDGQTSLDEIHRVTGR